MKEKEITIVAYYFGKKLGAGVFMENLHPLLIPKLQDAGYNVTLVTNSYFLQDCGSKIPSNVNIISPRWLMRPSFSKLYFLLFFGFTRYVRNAQCVLFSIDSIIGFRMKNVVSIIHDINEFALENKLGRFRTFFRKQMIKQTLKKARQVIVISNFVREQIATYLPQLYSDKINVIHSGISMFSFSQETEAPQLSPFPYFIIVGRIDPKAKCLYEAVTVFSAYQKKHPEFRLKIVGGINAFCQEDANEFLSVISRNENIEYLGYVSDKDLDSLYRNAFATIFMSKLEGFGFPLLESFYRGCPVITSTENAVNKEISSNLDIDIADAELAQEELICEKIDKTQQINKEDLIHTALQFTWEKTAARYYEFLMAIYSKP